MTSGTHNKPPEESANGEHCSVVLFDGLCNLCNGAVRFIIARDRKERFRFASLQSTIGRRFLAEHRLGDSKLNTLVLLEGRRAWTRSTAALRIARRLSGPWPLLYALVFLPRLLRDPLYALLAHNRYRWFGRLATCWLPSPELRKRFLDQEDPAP